MEGTLLYHIFDWNAGNRSQQSHRFCKFPIKNLEKDFIKDYLEVYKGLFIINPSSLFDITGFYIKDGLHNFIFHCSIDKEDSTMTISYGYPQYQIRKVKPKDYRPYNEQVIVGD